MMGDTMGWKYALLFLLLLSGKVEAQTTQPPTATVLWTLPTTRINGQPFSPSDISSVQLFDGTELLGICEGPCNSMQSGDLGPGVHSFAVIVVDTSNRMSALSAASIITLYSITLSVNPADAGTISVTPGLSGIKGYTVTMARKPNTSDDTISAAIKGRNPSPAKGVLAVLN
jgi:hypothetical protein